MQTEAFLIYAGPLFLGAIFLEAVLSIRDDLDTYEKQDMKKEII